MSGGGEAERLAALLAQVSQQGSHQLLFSAAAAARAQQPQPPQPPPQPQLNPPLNASILQLAAIQQQLQAQPYLLPSIHNPALSALYYSQLISQLQPPPPTGPGGSVQAEATPPPPQPQPPTRDVQRPSPQLPLSSLPTPAQAAQSSGASLPQNQGLSVAAVHPALQRVSSDTTASRRRSTPVLPSQSSLATIPEVAAAAASGGGAQSASPQRPPLEKKPSLSSPKEIQNHIDALIRQNEAAVQPEAPLLRQRRSYQRQGQGLASPPKSKQSAGRSVSLVESQLQVNLAMQQQRQAYVRPRGSLPAQLPSVSAAAAANLHFGGPQIPTTDAAAAAALHRNLLLSAGPATLSCEHCGLGFRNELSLQAHVFRCAARQPQPQPQQSQPAQSTSTGAGEAPPPLVASHTPLAQSLSLDPALLSQLQQAQLAAAQTESLAAVAAAAVAAQKAPEAPAAKSQHPLKKRILAEHAEATTASSPAPPPPKLAKVEKAAPAPPAPPPVSVSANPPPPLVRPVPTRLPPKTSPALAQSSPVPGPSLPPSSAAPPANTALSLAVTLSAAEKNQSFQPYTRTIEVEGGESGGGGGDGGGGGGNGGGAVRGRRPRHVTAPTFVCMKRPQPFFLPHSDPKRSMYSTWQQVAVNPMDAKLNLIWMGGCCTRPRPGSHPFWKYTTATKELGVPRMTHSSFSLVSKKLRSGAQDPTATASARPTGVDAATETPATKEELWHRVMAENAERLRRRSTVESEEQPPLRIVASPQTSDTDDACEIEESPAEKKKPLPAPAHPNADGALNIADAPTQSFHFVRERGGAQTPPMRGSAAAAESRLSRDCQSVPPIQLSPCPRQPPVPATTPPPPPPTSAAPATATAPLTPSANLSPYLAAPSALHCQICAKKFPKTEQLRLHMTTHYYQEAHASRRKAPSEAKDEDGAAARNSDDPRPYKCLDCDSAFRAQGFLQKHLRSKLHVMKLECMGKLPFGTFALFEAAQFNLAEIDTTDVEAALHSMQRHALRLMPRFPEICDRPNKDQMPPNVAEDTKPPPKAAKTEAPSPSLVCTESSIPASPPTPSSQPAKEEPLKETPISPTTSAKSVAAELWVPPKETEIPKTLPPAAPPPPPLPAKAQIQPAAPAAPQPQLVVAKNGTASEGSGRSVKAEAAVHVCHFCKLEAVSGTDLEVHLHADHIALKDGHDFRCPRPNCDKIFPSRESLRHHIAAHYLGGGSGGLGLGGVGAGGGSGGGGGGSDGDVSRETMAALRGKLGANGGGSGGSGPPAAGAVGNESPGTPEESQTSFAAVSGGRKKMKTHLVALNSIPEGAGAVLAGSPLSEGGSETSTPSPIPKGLKRRSIEEPLSGRRCASALDAQAAASMGQSQATAFSLPALSEQVARQAPLSWLDESLLRLNPSISFATCPLCHLQTPDIRTHLLSHVSSRPHVCAVCDAGFTTKEALDSHAATHAASV